MLTLKFNRSHDDNTSLQATTTSTVCVQVGLDRKTGDDTRLTYCTTGVLLEILVNRRDMRSYTHIVLDEVHERDQESDFCLLLVNMLLRKNSRDVKVSSVCAY